MPTHRIEGLEGWLGKAFDLPMAELVSDENAMKRRAIKLDPKRKTLKKKKKKKEKTLSKLVAAAYATRLEKYLFG